MSLLASLFVGRPLTIAAVAAVFAVLHAVRRAGTLGAGRSSRPALVAAVAWAAYAAWEWLVLVRTPDANIRVDLLVIWPVMAVVSAWAVYRALR